MDFDFLDKSLIDSSAQAMRAFKQVVDQERPIETELEGLYARIRAYPHTTRLIEEYLMSAVDGSGEFPVVQQDDIFLHFLTAAAATYQTASRRQHKLSALHLVPPTFKQFVVLSDDDAALRSGYRSLIRDMLGMDLKDLVAGSDYCEAFSQFGATLRPKDVSWQNMALSKASQVATHAYLLRSLAELGMAIRVLPQRQRYLLLDTSLVYFLLGESLYLPELLKRYLITQANAQGTGVIALCKSHNIPNGDLLSRHAREQMGLKDHWYLRLPSAALGEPIPRFLEGREIPPKLSVSYLFKFEATSFPMRIDVDAAWWQKTIDGDEAREQQLFGDLDFTCHEVRSYGYPYPMHAAHRSSALSRKERNLLRDLLMQNAHREGVGPGAFQADPEQLHMTGM